VAGTLAASAATGPAPPAVRCYSIIGSIGSGHADGYRIVLGVASVPPAFLPQVVPTRERPWAYWRKAGLLIRRGTQAVNVSVPPAWRRRVAITWGNSQIVSALRFRPCPIAGKTWNAYAGGFYLRSRTACVPLIFRAGRRTAVVRFGVGRRCR
jgi:hypothetical protein